MAQSPSRVRRTWPVSEKIEETYAILQSSDMNTVCVSARCPNLGECFARGVATFIILGNVCTRNCRFCAVPKGKPAEVDPEEPHKTADAALRLGLKHVVITSVTRDDLPDKGAGHFAAAVRAVKEKLPHAAVEVLTPDFQGDFEAISAVVEAGPDIYNHNIETVPRLYPEVRPRADYLQSLRVLQSVKEIRPEVYTKSGLMVGLGESISEVDEAMTELRGVGCDILTIGQYLQPTPHHLQVREFISPEVFADYKGKAMRLGFLHAESGVFVRSSYHAEVFSPLQRRRFHDGDTEGRSRCKDEDQTLLPEY